MEVRRQATCYIYPFNEGGWHVSDFPGGLCTLAYRGRKYSNLIRSQLQGISLFYNSRANHVVNAGSLGSAVCTSVVLQTPNLGRRVHIQNIYFRAQNPVLQYIRITRLTILSNNHLAILLCDESLSYLSNSISGLF